MHVIIRLVRHTYLTDDVVDDAFSDMLRQAMLLAEVLHEKTLLLAAALPRRSREAEDIMVILLAGDLGRREELEVLLSLLFLLPDKKIKIEKIQMKIQINHGMQLDIASVFI